MSNKYSRILLVLIMLMMTSAVKAQDVADSIVVKVQNMSDSIVVNVERVADNIIVKVRNVSDSTALKVQHLVDSMATSVQTMADSSAIAVPEVADSTIAEPLTTITPAITPTDVQLDNINTRRDRVKAYVKERGMISRDAVKTVFIPRGQWMLGGQVAWNQWDNDNLNYLVLKDINFEGHTFSAGPYFGYFFANNLAVGGRFSYQRYYFNLGELDLNLGEDLNISLKDLYYLQHNYETTAFLRSYLPLGNSKIFGFFGELQFNYTLSEGRNNTGIGDTFTAVYEKTHNIEVGLGGGMAVFLTDFMAAEVMLNVGGYRFKWGDQNTNNIEQGKLNYSGANFRLNLFSIKFGLTYYL